VPSRNGWPLAVAPAASRRIITIQGLLQALMDTSACLCFDFKRLAVHSSV
jgi:hypothetical protein